MELLIILLVVFWLLGFYVVPIGGLVHVLLVVALVLFIYRMVKGRPVL